MWSIMTGTAGSLRMEIGTLESILLTITSIYTMVIAYTAFSAIFGFISIIVLVVFGFALFGISVFATASTYTLIFLLPSMIMMTADSDSPYGGVSGDKMLFFGGIAFPNTSFFFYFFVEMK